MNTKPSKNRPSHAVYLVEGEGESAYWTKIGSAWAHENDKGFNVTLAAIPVNGRLVVLKREPKQQEGKGA